MFPSKDTVYNILNNQNNCEQQLLDFYNAYIMAVSCVSVYTDAGDYKKYYLKDGINSVVFEGCDADSCSKAIRRAISFSKEEYIAISTKARECAERQFDYHNWSKKIKQAIESMCSEKE